jgi:hypothetical protein
MSKVIPKIPKKLDLMVCCTYRDFNVATLLGKEGED